MVREVTDVVVVGEGDAERDGHVVPGVDVRRLAEVVAEVADVVADATPGRSAQERLLDRKHDGLHSWQRKQSFV